MKMVVRGFIWVTGPRVPLSERGGWIAALTFANLADEWKDVKEAGKNAVEHFMT